MEKIVLDVQQVVSSKSPTIFMNAKIIHITNSIANRTIFWPNFKGNVLERSSRR